MFDTVVYKGDKVHTEWYWILKRVILKIIQVDTDAYKVNPELSEGRF